jgi:hypothetical protein
MRPDLGVLGEVARSPNRKSGHRRSGLTVSIPGRLPIWWTPTIKADLLREDCAFAGFS